MSAYKSTDTVRLQQTYTGGNMKILLLGSLIVISLSAIADDKKDDGFAAHKTEALAGLDKRISAMQEHKTCVTAANDKDAMKVCHEKMKDFRMENRSEHMGKRHERMGEKMKKHEERMKNE